MKYSSLVLFIIILSVKADAQNNYFNKAYKFDVYNNASAILKDSDNFIFVSWSADSSLVNGKIAISKIDSAGSLLWTKIYGASQCNYVPNSLIKKIISSSAPESLVRTLIKMMFSYAFLMTKAILFLQKLMEIV